MTLNYFFIKVNSVIFKSDITYCGILQAEVVIYFFNLNYVVFELDKTDQDKLHPGIGIGLLVSMFIVLSVNLCKFLIILF